MAKRHKITIALSDVVLQWLHKKVDNGDEASVGWVIEKLVRKEMVGETA
jgi:hemerythrin